MIVFTKFVSLDEFEELRRSTSYTKLEIRPNENRKLTNIKVYCYLKHNIGNDQSNRNSELGQMKASLINASRREKFTKGY